ncbi:MAG: long-chain-fatty-acid--CoA ligase [Chloroflexi bacterium]|nr:long-chain-fatty-acid--CoA ligase [Chloroflexota bacterium]
MLTTEFLNIVNAICPDKEAVVFEGQRLTYAELNQRANKLAHALTRLGVGQGDRVAIMQVNTPQVVESYFATAKLGAIWVPVNFRAKAEEVAHMVKLAEAKVMMVGERYVPLVQSVHSNLTSLHHCVSLDGPTPDMQDYEPLLCGTSEDEVNTEVPETDTTILMFTAGTTGLPKGVMLSHQSFGLYVLNNVTPADPEAAEKNILTVPLYHVAGVQAMLAGIYGGRTLVLQRQFELPEWMAIVQREQVNRAMLVPTMLKQVMDHPDFGQYDLGSLKVITYGAAPMPLEVIKRAIQLFPSARFIQAFGQTESASTIMILPPDDHVLTGTQEEVDKKLKHLTSIGKPMEDVEMKVVDEEGNEVPRGTPGEILARGPRVMSGYWKNPEATAKTVRGGWLYTGDFGYMDEDSYVYLVGRGGDIIKRGGEKISPDEIEACLTSHPKVDEAAVIGVPDPDWGEVIKAVVVLKKGQQAQPQELIEHCRVHMSSFKKPESIVFVDELPRNPMGKVLRRVLREQYGKGELFAKR